MTSIQSEIVPILRRTINDVEEPYVYTNNALTEHIIDAITGVKLKWEHDYTVDSSDNVEPDVKEEHKVLFALIAKLQILDTSPSVSFRSGTLSVTRKDDTQRRLERKINNAIENLKLEQNISYLKTEFD